MQRINWDEKLSDEDIVWLRQTGIRGIEDRITQHQAQFDADVPEPETPEDTATKGALDPNEGANEGRVVSTNGQPENVTPPVEEEPEVEDVEGDDYETWSKAELEAEVKARDDMPDTTSVEVTGTGRDGAVLKVDMVKGLRLWDQENPGALDKD